MKLSFLSVTGNLRSNEITGYEGLQSDIVHSEKNPPHSSPVKVRYGVSFISSYSEQGFNFFHSYYVQYHVILDYDISRVKYKLLFFKSAYLDGAA